MYLRAAETKLGALEQSLSTLRQEHPDIAQHIASEVSARENLAQLSKELAHYKSVLGQAAETNGLAQQLQEKESELQKSRLLAEQHAQAESSLYAEIDRLSSSWENLEQQVKKKIFDLSNSEEKLQRVMHEVNGSVHW